MFGERLQRAKALFESALELDGEERISLLHRECGSDVQLRRFVEGLLSSHESGGDSFLAPPPPETATVQMSPGGPRIGTKIGPYEITGELGRGGMGTVYEGWDTLLRRRVAIKFVAEAFAHSEQARQRFLREARAASNLSHSGIATVHNAGEHEDQLYIVFRLIDGETVADRLQGGPLELADALRLVREAAEALGHAHEQGVLHRDVTSRNLMIDHDGSAVIVDFGLALPEMDSRITQPGSTFGTLGYLAPEVVQGKEHDRRSDLYGLGVVFYEMLTGSLPFATDRAESLLYAIVNEPLQAPSVRRPEVGEDVDRVLLKLLARDPEDRYQSTAELVADLKRLQQGLAPVAERPRSGSRHRRWIVAAVVVVVVGAAATIGRLAIGPPSASEPAPEAEEAEPIKMAVLPLQNNSARPEESDYMALGMSEALATKLGRIRSLRVTPWITSQNYPPQRLPLQDIATELGVDQLVVGTFRHEGERLQIRLSYVDGASGMQDWAEEFVGVEDEILRIPERIATSVVSRLGRSLGEEDRAALAVSPTEEPQAYKLYLKGVEALRVGTEAATTKALGYFNGAIALDTGLAAAHVGIGAAYTTQIYNGWSRESDALEKAESEFRAALALDPELWAGHRGLLRVAFYRGQSEECLRIGAATKGADPEEVEALQARAEAFYYANLDRLALPVLERILEIDPANQAAALFSTFCRVESPILVETSIGAAESYLRQFGEDVDVYLTLGMACDAIDRIDDARIAFARAMELLGTDQNYYAGLLAGLLELRTGNVKAAENILRPMAARMEGLYQLDPRNTRNSEALAAVGLLLGDPDRCEELRARTRHSQTSTKDLLAMAYAHVGRTSEALEVLNDMLDSGSLQFFRPMWQWESLDELKKEPGYESYRQRMEAELARLRALYGPDSTRS